MTDLEVQEILTNAPPGSVEARRHGCVCPVIDNSYGKGWGTYEDGTITFVWCPHCIVHGEWGKIYYRMPD